MTQGFSINELQHFSLLKKNTILFNLPKNPLFGIGVSHKEEIWKDWLNNLMKKYKKELKLKDTDLLKIKSLVRSNKQLIKSDISNLPPISHKPRSSASKAVSSLLNSNKKMKRNASEKKWKGLVDKKITSLECLKIPAYQNTLLDIHTLENDINRFGVESNCETKRSFTGNHNHQVTLKKRNKFKEFIKESEETSEKDCIIILARKKPIISRFTPIINTEEKAILSARVDVPKIKIKVNKAKSKDNLPQPISRKVISTNKKMMCDAWTDTIGDEVFKLQGF